MVSKCCGESGGVWGLRCLATVARVAMSRGIVCGYGVGSYCEGRVDVINTMGVFLEDERMLSVYCSEGYRIGGWW